MTKQELQKQRHSFSLWFADLRDAQKADGAPVPNRSEMWEEWLERYRQERESANS